MVRGGQDIDVCQVAGHRQRPHQLRGVHEDDRSDCAGDAADGGDVGTVAGRALDRAERDHPGRLVHVLRHVVGLEAPVAEGDLAHVVPLGLELAPGEVVRAVLPLPDDDVLARAGRPELGGHEARHRREGRDQRDVAGVRTDQPGDGGACSVGGALTLREVEALLGPSVDDPVVGVGERPAGQADGRGVQVGPVRRRREQPTRVTDLRHGGRRCVHDDKVRRSLRSSGALEVTTGERGETREAPDGGESDEPPDGAPVR